MRHFLALVALALISTSIGAQRSGSSIVQHVLQEEGWIGILPDSSDPLRILEVAARSPAAQRGIRAGDRIFEIDGQPATPELLFHQRFKVGETIRLGIIRDNERLVVASVQVVENPYFALTARKDSVAREGARYLSELIDEIRREPRKYFWIYSNGGFSSPDSFFINYSSKTFVADTQAANRSPEEARKLVRDLQSFEVASQQLRQLQELAAQQGQGQQGQQGRGQQGQGRQGQQGQGIQGRPGQQGQGRQGQQGQQDRAILEARRLIQAQQGSAMIRDSILYGQLVEAARTMDQALARVASRKQLLSGAELEQLNPALGEYFGGVSQGVFVLRTTDGTPAVTAGLRAGDIVESVNGKRVLTIDELLDTVAQQTGPINLTIVRRGQRSTVALRR